MNQISQSEPWPFSQEDFKYTSAQIIAINAMYPVGPIVANPVVLHDGEKSSFYTSDSAVYVLEKGKPILYFGTPEINPILKNMPEAIRQLTLEENYFVSGKDLTNAINPEHAVRISLSKLELTLSNQEWGSFKVPTDYLDRRMRKKMNSTQTLLAEKVYGEKLTNLQDMTLSLSKNWELLDLFPAQIFTLTPEYVKKHVTKNQGIIRLCKLGYPEAHNSGCIFSAMSRIQS